MNFIGSDLESEGFAAFVFLENEECIVADGDMTMTLLFSSFK